VVLLDDIRVAQTMRILGMGAVRKRVHRNVSPLHTGAEMLVAFKLSMPGNNSWNGRWSGEGACYARVINVGTSKKAREKYAALCGHHGYNFGDGWRANVMVEEVDVATARKLRKASRGFCGYDWMIDSLRFKGHITTDKS
jgi:hypothetical protein